METVGGKADKVLTMGEGLAWSYFYGYLNLVLPGLKQRIRESEFCRDESKNKIPFLQKMIIILPESCFCPGSLTDDDPNIVHQGFIPFSATRAGNIRRDYKSSVYKIKHPRTNEEFYALVEYATPLLSMYEMQSGEVSNLAEDAKITHSQLFHSSLQQTLTHPKHQHVHDVACFLQLTADSRDEKQKPVGWRLSEKLVDKIKAEMTR